MEISEAKYFVYLNTDDRGIYVAKDVEDVRATDKYSKRLCAVYGVFDTEIGDTLYEVDSRYDGSLYIGFHKFMHITSVLGFYPYSKIFCYDVDSYNYVYDKLLDLVDLSDYKNTMSIVKLYEKPIKKDYAWVYLNNVIQKGEIITRVGWIYILKFKTEKDFIAICDHDVYFDFDEIMSAYRNGKIKRRII